MSSTAAEMESFVLVERPVAGVALLRLNRPERRNALSLSMRRVLADHISTLTSDAGVRCIVITGNERAFAAGADITELANASPNDPLLSYLRVAWMAIERCRKPILAAVNGFALGAGCELALQCDIVIAGQGATFGQPEVKLGIMPGAGGVQRFVRVLGRLRALRWLLTGDLISAQRAFDMGLVSEIVPDADVVDHALALAGKIAALPKLAVEAIKESVLQGANAPLDVALQLERKAFELLFATADQKEGFAAFIERREPRFTGR